MYRAAIIGCGGIGAAWREPNTGSSRINSHAEAYKTLPNTHLVAVCDADKVRLKTCAERWCVACIYDSLEELLKCQELDLISICTPTMTHAETLNAVLRREQVAGVLLEKPLALDLNTADSVIARANKSSVNVAVNYVRRFLPVYQEMAVRIRGGEFGAIQHVNVYYGKGIINNGGHALDLLRLFFGEPDSISLLSPLHQEQADPTLDVKLKFDGGFEAWMCGTNAELSNIFEIDILAAQARIVFRDQGHIVDYFRVEDTRKQHGFRQLSRLPESRPTDLSKGVQFAIEDLIAGIERKQPASCTLEDARAALKLSLDAIRASHLVGSCP